MIRRLPIIALAVLSACSADRGECLSSIVVDKHHRPAGMVWQPRYDPATKTTRMQWVFVSDRWRLCIARTWSSSDPTIGWEVVSKGDFEAAVVGKEAPE